MKRFWAYSVVVAILAVAAVLAADSAVKPIPSGFSDESLHGDNSAFFEGDSLDYVLSAPTGFRLIIDEAIKHDYSLAFIPATTSFDSAEVMIAVNIFTDPDGGATPPLTDFITTDTAAIARHYGPGLTILKVALTHEVDNRGFISFYLNDKTRFIPDVLLSYYSGGKEILVFQLSIREGFPRFEAEKAFVECLARFRTLMKGSTSDFSPEQ